MRVDLQTATVGSHLHGTATPESDLDLAVIYIDDTVALAGNPLPKARQSTSSEVDITQFEIGKIIELVKTGNPTALEALYSPKITRVNTSHPYLMDRFQEIKESLLVCVEKPIALNAALGYATSCVTQAAKGTRVDKQLKAAVRILKNAKVFAESGNLYFGGGAGLNEAWATRGALFEKYLELQEEVTAYQEDSFWNDPREYEVLMDHANQIDLWLREMRRYVVTST